MPAWLLAALLATAGPAMAAAGHVHAIAVVTPDGQAEASAEALLALPEELRLRFQAEVLSHTSSPARRLDAMMGFLFDPDGLGMRYDAQATHSVADAYRTRQANCLSFTLLTVALAREAGFEAFGQRHDRILAWRQQDSNLVLSNHVNAGILTRQRHYTIDVASDSVIAQGLPARMADAELAGLYHSNRAMERVLDGDIAGALPQALHALALDPRSATLWNNAGVAHLRSGDLAAAVLAYERAMELDPQHSGALFNLAQAYQRQGDAGRAGHLRERMQRVLARDPFHHFLQGHAAEGHGDLPTAEAHYRRAIRLLGGEHRFHFALARVQTGLGDQRAALRSLRRARELGGDADRPYYQSKLDLLQARLHR